MPATFANLNTTCSVYSRPDVRKSTGVRGVSFTDCLSTEKIDTTGDGKPDDVSFRLVTVLDKHGALLCWFWTADGPGVHMTSGDCS